MDENDGRPTGLRRLGLWIKRTGIALYGPADLPDDVDPLTAIDDELGRDRHAPREPHRTERQEAYDNLPREHE